MQKSILYAQKESSADKLCTRKDTVFYSDADCTKVYARMPWYITNHPTRARNFVTINCYRWQLVWA